MKPKEIATALLKVERLGNSTMRMLRLIQEPSKPETIRYFAEIAKRQAQDVITYMRTLERRQKKGKAEVKRRETRRA